MKTIVVIKKEILDGIRNYRFLIITMTYLFFAILNPVMNRFFLPSVLRSQFPNMTEELLNDMIQMTQLASVRGYIDSALQLGTIVTVLILSGVIAQEISERTFLIPTSTGKRFSDLVLGKLIVYGSGLIVVNTLCIVVNYLYSGVIFGFDMYSIIPVVRAGILLGIYMTFLLGLLMLVGSFTRKPITAGLLVLLPGLFMGYIGSLFRIDRFLPSGLIAEGQLMAMTPSRGVYQSLIITLALIALSTGFTVIGLCKTELTKG